MKRKKVVKRKRVAPKAVKRKRVAPKALKRKRVAPKVVKRKRVAPKTLKRKRVATKAVKRKRVAPKVVKRKRTAAPKVVKRKRKRAAPKTQLQRLRAELRKLKRRLRPRRKKPKKLKKPYIPLSDKRRRKILNEAAASPWSKVENVHMMKIDDRGHLLGRTATGVTVRAYRVLCLATGEYQYYWSRVSTLTGYTPQQFYEYDDLDPDLYRVDLEF